MLLLNIFRHIGADIVYLEICDLLTLSTLNGLLPKLKEIILSDTKIPIGVRVDFNQFSKLKSVAMPLPGLCPLSLSSNSNQPPEKRSKELIINLEGYPNDNINTLATLAPSLRLLRLGYDISQYFPALETCFSRELDLGNSNVEEMRSRFPRFRRTES
uniref:Uncharacterized protein n=1 Tax=Glossina austeni TaxID=7395 RepID=A0A1A9V2R6_GLOAU